MNRYYIILIILILSSCSNRPKNQSRHELEFIRKTEKFNQILLGKKITILPKILGDSISINNEKKVLLVTVGSDCSGCRYKGVEIISNINNLYEKKIGFVIGFGIGKQAERESNYLEEPIYHDNKSIIQHELNLFVTPSLVLLDRNNCVDKILSIFAFDDVEGYNETKEFDDFVMAVHML